MNPLIHIVVPGYGLMTFLGIFSSLIFVYLRSYKFGVAFKKMIILALIACFGMFIGSKFLFIITKIPDMIAYPTKILSIILTSGFVFYGGLAGALIAIILYSKKANLETNKILNWVTPTLPLFHMFGRIGCLLAGCCYGIESSWGVHLYFDADNVYRVPTQLFESFFNIILFIGLLIYERFKIKKGDKYLLLSKYLFCYSVFRFFIEFFRGDMIRGIWFGLSTSQWISLIFIAAILFKFFKNKYGKYNDVIAE